MGTQSVPRQGGGLLGIAIKPPSLSPGGRGKVSRKKAKERFSICCVAAAVSVYFNLKL